MDEKGIFKGVMKKRVFFRKILVIGIIIFFWGCGISVKKREMPQELKSFFVINATIKKATELAEQFDTFYEVKSNKAKVNEIIKLLQIALDESKKIDINKMENLYKSSGEALFKSAIPFAKNCLVFYRSVENFENIESFFTIENRKRVQIMSEKRSDWNKWMTENADHLFNVFKKYSFEGLDKYLKKHDININRGKK